LSTTDRTADRRPRISPSGSLALVQTTTALVIVTRSIGSAPRSKTDAASRCAKKPASGVLAEAYSAGQYQHRWHRLFSRRSARWTGASRDQSQDRAQEVPP